MPWACRGHAVDMPYRSAIAVCEHPKVPPLLDGKAPPLVAVEPPLLDDGEAAPRAADEARIDTDTQRTAAHARVPLGHANLYVYTNTHAHKHT